MGDLMEILVVLYVIIGTCIGGGALFNTIEGELTRGRLVSIIVFLPQSVVAGIFFGLIAVFVWAHDRFTYGNNKLNKWWTSPIRFKKQTKERSNES